MSRTINIETPPDFSFRHTVYSHGWSELAPFKLNTEKWALEYVFEGAAGAPVRGTISETATGLKAKFSGDVDKARATSDIRHILQLDEDLDPFYAQLEKNESLAWIKDAKAGRLIRSPSVFEDLVKTLCTTNCSWGLTKNMVNNLVNELGEKSSDGDAAFPTAQALAGVDEAFYREKIKAGYRSPFFVGLAQRVASGEIDPEAWLTSELPTPELKKQIKQIKGIGDYAAENLLKLIGRYDGLALDSWLRAQFYRKHNGDKPCPDKKIEKYYSKYGDWKGLTIWCDMTERWFDEKVLKQL